MAIAVTSSPPTPMSVLCITRLSSTTMMKSNPKQNQGRGVGNFGHFVQVVRNDVKYLKNRMSEGINWANETLRLPQLSRTVDDILWLRNLEDPLASSLPTSSWPQPHYPEFSGVDLFVADLRALEAYANYFYYLSKKWTKPLPEGYDPQEVADYFSRRPHVVVLRLLEVFSSFASAAIRIRVSGIRKLYRSSVDKDIENSILQYNFGVVLKETMLKLGPTFIKVGQSLSTRPDIIGSEISKALSELHDQIPPFPRMLAMKIIKEELGSPVETFFRYISEEPVAAASFGQVYKGITVDGFNVAVKVQRPNLRHVVVRDIYIIRLALGLVQKIAKRKSDPRLYADELGKGLVGELDYSLEAEHAMEFMEAHSTYSFISVPKVFQHLSRKRVLTMEWMHGENPSDLLSISTKESIKNGSRYSARQQSDAKRRLLDLVNKGVEATLVQLLETGLLHADPHPGNLRYTSTGQLGFLDFGLLCRMEKKHQFAMLASIVHIVNGDWASLVHALTEMDVVIPGTNIRHVTMDLEDALGEVEFKEGIPDVKFSRVLGKIWSVAFKYHFRMPPYYTLVLRSIASFEGLAITIDPNFKTFEAAYPYVVHKLLTDNSAATRKILYSVVLNRRREFQWQKLALFLKVGTTRKRLHPMLASNTETSLDYSPSGATGVFDIANLVLMLLPSKDGGVLRRLLVTADGASIVRAMVSKEAVHFRQQLCRIIADIMYQWMFEAHGGGATTTQYSSQVRLATGDNLLDPFPSSRLATPNYDYQSILKDRRLKVIFFKILDSARKDPALMLRFYWASFVMFLKASALACHRVLVSFSETLLGPVSFVPKQFAVAAS
ncbi:uncharacterized protein LOC132271059 isoform X1 [Cornus florida]|uniref:uncharacterized protein LOC132271059 isoform X1 n=1 Tax=Cornus florida TaxID=4283 RepID=UPI0028972291|nr:uncharacterized protein LOC132271059 isoform X1 [Cornus florida]